MWHYYENDGMSTRWYDNGGASTEHGTKILENWLLNPSDVVDVIRTSPSQLDDILRGKAEKNPKKVRKSLESIRERNYSNLEYCYCPVSVRLIIQCGLRKEEEVAEELQKEHNFHFGEKPAVYSYDKTPVYADNYFIPGKENGSERQFLRFRSKKDPQFYLEDLKNLSLVLSDA